MYEGMKTCNKCQETLPLSRFHRNKAMADGRLNQCRSCHNAITRANGRDRRARNPGADNAYVNRWRADNREKVNAQQKVHRAVRAGLLHKPDKCGYCQIPGPVDAHHPDYDRPLEVKWLCRKCHRAQHSRGES